MNYFDEIMVDFTSKITWRIPSLNHLELSSSNTAKTRFFISRLCAFGRLNRGGRPTGAAQFFSKLGL
jgi:hypothetical protein